MPSRAQLERTIAQLDAAIAALPEEVASAEAPNTTIEVRIGTTEMAAADEELVGRIADLINSAYFAALRELLPPHATTYSRVDEDDVYHRLEMGDAGARANRVLHLAFRDDGVLVGACSSTYQPQLLWRNYSGAILAQSLAQFWRNSGAILRNSLTRAYSRDRYQPPWCEEGCGHWGLVAVAPEAQGGGVASALVRAAELRLAGACGEVQIEYEYTVGHAYSERLRQWYETKLGFGCAAGPPRGPEGSTQFRKCRKVLSEAACRVGRRRHLTELRRHFESELAHLSQ